MAGEYATGKDALDRIVDCITNEPIPFIQLVATVRQLDQQAAAGNEDAAKIVSMVKSFARLIDVAGDKRARQ